jgi:hypothetical protein
MVSNEKWVNNTIPLESPFKPTPYDYLEAWHASNDETFTLEQIDAETFKNFIFELFYPEEFSNPSRLEYSIGNALEEINNLTSDEEFKEIIKLGVITFGLAAAYKFESLDAYFQYGDLKGYYRNIFHPVRMIALSSYMSQLILLDHIRRAQMINHTLHPYEINLLCESQINSFYLYRPHFQSFNNNARVHSNLPIIKINWDLVSAFTSTPNNITNQIITPNEWRTFGYTDYNIHIKELKRIYSTTDININLVLQCLPLLMRASEFERI